MRGLPPKCGGRVRQRGFNFDFQVEAPLLGKGSRLLNLSSNTIDFDFQVEAPFVRKRIEALTSNTIDFDFKGGSPRF
jgi:hypothetical protein